MMKNRKIDLIDISKYAMVLVIFVYVVILIIGQGGDVPMEKVQKNVLKSVKIKEMREAGTQDFKRYYGLNANDYEDVALYLPNDVMGAEELLLVRVKDDSQIEAVSQAAQKRLEADPFHQMVKIRIACMKCDVYFLLPIFFCFFQLHMYLGGGVVFR